jgi:hypothetical protein
MITQISGSLAGVVSAIELSRATMRNIRQNLFFVLAYNAIGIPLAAGVLYPFFGIQLSPVIAAAAMALSSLSVVTNANRLRRWRPAPLPAQPAGGCGAAAWAVTAPNLANHGQRLYAAAMQVTVGVRGAPQVWPGAHQNTAIMTELIAIKRLLGRLGDA